MSGINESASLDRLRLNLIDHQATMQRIREAARIPDGASICDKIAEMRALADVAEDWKHRANRLGAELNQCRGYCSSHPNLKEQELETTPDAVRRTMMENRERFRLITDALNRRDKQLAGERENFNLLSMRCEQAESDRDKARMLRDAHWSEVRELRDILNRSGFQRCDVPACNCGGWHQVEGYAARFREIDDAVGDHHGNTLLDAVKELVAYRDRTEAALLPICERIDWTIRESHESLDARAAMVGIRTMLRDAGLWRDAKDGAS